MEEYIGNYNNYNSCYVYDFKLGDGGIGDYIKFFMIILSECVEKKIRLYHIVNNIEIEKYIKFKFDEINIQRKDICKLKNVTIKKPYMYYNKVNLDFKLCVGDVFVFDSIIKENVKKILPNIPKKYISLHLRLGDKFLETEKKFVVCKNDIRIFSEEKLFELIENKKNSTIIFFCDNKSYKLKIKNKYNNVKITDAKIAHTSLKNVTNEEVLDTVTEFYILTNSEEIYGISKSGFSLMASEFKNIDYLIRY